MGVFFGRMVFSSVPLGGPALLLRGGAALLFLAVEAAFRLDVDFPAGELGGQAGVLPLVADGRESWLSGTVTLQEREPSSASSTESTLAGESAAAMNCLGSSLYSTMSIFSPAQLVHNL